jgi:Fe-S-cluster containining protein
MVEFVTKKEEIELKGYDPGTTLKELSEALEEYRLTCRLKTYECKGCGECCSDSIPVLGLDLQVLQKGLGINFEQAVRSILSLPEKPDMNIRRKSIKEISASASITPLEATLMYEYNNAEPIILARQNGGECCFLQESLCSRYQIRPYSCGLYLCNMGEKLSYIQEMIIRQGTWHAYYTLGWISKGDIAHNPFLKSDSYEKLLLADFDFNLENALAQMFFYF